MENTPQKPGTASYVIAGLGFIPLLGLLFAFIAIVLGFAKFRRGGKKLVLLGVLGILFTVVLYGTLFYEGFVVRGGIYDELREGLARTSLTNLVKSIEYFKLTHGRYPDSLQELQSVSNKDSLTIIYDPTFHPSLSGDEKQFPTFFYKLTPDKTHYYLLSTGPDQQPFTKDDILPDLPGAERAKTGLLINPSSLPDQNVPLKSH